MQVTTEHHGGHTVIGLAGRLNMKEAPVLRLAGAEVVAGGVRRVVLDLGGVEFVDSSGLGALVGSLKTVRQAGGDLRIAQVGPQVQVALELTSLHRVLPLGESAEKAFGDD